MEINQFFKSVIDADRAPIVICAVDHTVLYVNPAAEERYSHAGNLVGRNLLECHAPRSQEIIEKTIKWFSECTENNIVFESRNETENKDVYMVALRDAGGRLIGYYEKHEYRTHDSGEPLKFE